MTGVQAVQTAPVPRGETFRILGVYWDVDRLNADLDANPGKVFTARTEIFRGGLLDQMEIDASALDTLECPDRPIIVVGLDINGKKGKFVADGNHRVTRALRDRQEGILVYYVPPEREGEFRL